MIWLSSSDSVHKSAVETDEDKDQEEEVVETDDDDDDNDVDEGGKSMWAASAAAACTSRGANDTGRGSEEASSGKLRMAPFPFMLSAATSCALAAISAVGNVPSHILDFFRGSRISDTHFPQFRMRTPRYTGCLFESRLRFSVFEPNGAAAPDGDDGEVKLLSFPELLFWAETLIVRGFSAFLTVKKLS